MSVRNCTEVEIAVRHKGGTYLARAGRGRDAETASSTSSGFFAALRAAGKFFGARVPFGLSIKQRAEKIEQPTIYLATRGQRMVVIEFADDGQDFLYWTVNIDTGHVVDCGPFQRDTWTKVRAVNPQGFAVGQRPLIILPDGRGSQLNHAIIRIRKGFAS